MTILKHPAEKMTGKNYLWTKKIKIRRKYGKFKLFKKNYITRTKKI